MKYFFYCFLIPLLAAGITSASFAQPQFAGDSLKVMTYNIHHANPPSQPDTINLEAIIRCIQKEAPDLVALQEVDVHTDRSGRKHQAEQIANALGMHYFFAKAIDFQGGEYGQAVLSRYPIAEEQIHRLPSQANSGSEARILATVKVTLPTGTQVTFGTVHLDAGKQDDNRQLQAAELVHLATAADTPLIIAGDLNMTENDRAFDTLRSVFEPTCTDCAFTIPVITPTKAIDFILTAPKNQWSVRAHQVIPERYASDHLPVTAVLQLTP